VDFGYALFEKPVTVDSVFRKDEMLDLIGITRGARSGGRGVALGGHPPAAQDPSRSSQGTPTPGGTCVSELHMCMCGCLYVMCISS